MPNANEALRHINDAFDQVCPERNQGDIWRMVASLKARGNHDPLNHCRAAADMLHTGLLLDDWDYWFGKRRA